MSKKRKAESDQHTTLFDFFNVDSGSKAITPKKSTRSKKQKTASKPSGANQTVLGGKANPLIVDEDEGTVPDGVEVIELSDSDEESMRNLQSEMIAVNPVPTTLEDSPLARMERLPEDDLPLEHSRMTPDRRPPFIDCSTFFLDSPTKQNEDDTMLLEEEEEKTVASRLERLSTEEWGVGDDEGLSEGADTGTGASEPENEMDETGLCQGRDEETLLISDDEMEAEPSDLQFIELSDDEEPQSLPPGFKGKICPVCRHGFLSLNNLEFSSHVNQCLDTDPGTTPTKRVPKKDKVLTPLSSLPIPPHPETDIENAHDRKPAKSFNAFSFLMSRNKENEAWKEATEAENARWGRTKQKGKGKGPVAAKPGARKDGPNVKDEEIEDVGDDEEGDGKKIASKPPTTNGTDGARRPAPFYKVMQGMPIAVDAFRYGRIPGVTAYLLTHAHSDHYTNLSKSWKHGPIYCSETTANLIIHMLSVDPKWVHPLPMDTETILPDTGGVKVTLIEANHCPGSCLFFFEGKQTVNAGDSTYHSVFVGTARIFRYLHCGDFRACPQHVQHPNVKGKRLDLVYLDTTYLDPKYCFPPQRMVIDACAELATRIVKNGGDTDLLGQGPGDVQSSVKSWLGLDASPEKSVEAGESTTQDSVLVVFGTYTIGKERIVKATARALNTLIWCEPRKRAFFECQASLDPELQTMIGDDPLKCGVHVRPLQDITSDALLEYLELWKGRWSKVVGMRPTGWTYVPPSGTDTVNLQNIVQRDQNRVYNWSYLRPMRNSTPNVMLYGVPYSEHSSFFELTCFALSIQYVRMIATVNVGSAKSRAKMDSWFEKWESEKKRRDKNVVEGRKDAVIVPRHDEYW